MAVPVLLVGALGGVSPAGAQERDTIPRNPDAELTFEQGLSAFEQGDYETAYKRFRLVNEYSLNQKTTAALLMGGKALLQMGRYEEAIDLMDTLTDRFPDTSYRGNAKKVVSVARERLEQAKARPDTLHLGILLPMNSETVTLSQALFNGVRLAVDEHNGLRRRYVPPSEVATSDSFEVHDTADVYGDSLAEAEGRTTLTTSTDTIRTDSLRVRSEYVRRPDWIAKMHFQETGSTPDSVRSAVDGLVQENDVDVILGPLFSRTARAAGAAAEDARVLLVPPLATAKSVSEGRDYVFQANPTRSLRGRIMARFASEGLLVDSVAVIYERANRISSRMTKSFRAEAQRQDLGVPFVIPVDDSRGWSQLPEVVEADSTLTDSLLASTDTYYLPMAGRNAGGKIQDALTGLGRLNPNARVLGNAEWHDLPIRTQASTFTVTYTNDFFVETKRPAVQTYVRRYRILTGDTPDELSVRGRRLAYTGYDVARFLLKTLTPSARRPQPSVLRAAPLYEGLGTRIDFREGNVNRAMFFHRYRNERLERIR